MITPEPDKGPYLDSTYSLRTGHRIYDYLISRLYGSIIFGGAKASMAQDKSV